VAGGARGVDEGSERLTACRSLARRGDYGIAASANPDLGGRQRALARLTPKPRNEG